MLLSHYYQGKMEAGCDEAGRGCLAGSVYAAAVIFPEDYENAELNDSKQLTDRRRHQLREVIERDAVAWAVGIVTPEEIDRINILNASILAMHRALDQLAVRPEAIIVDGNRFKPYRPAAAMPTAVPASPDAAAPVPSSPDATAPLPAVSPHFGRRATDRRTTCRSRKTFVKRFWRELESLTHPYAHPLSSSKKHSQPPSGGPKGLYTPRSKDPGTRGKF
jgi:hypothetical protein